jgi:hypothetical protein
LRWRLFIFSLAKILFTPRARRLPDVLPELRGKMVGRIKPEDVRHLADGLRCIEQKLLGFPQSKMELILFRADPGHCLKAVAKIRIPNAKLAR